MMTRKHEHQIELPVTPERVFALLHTPSDICASWWFASSAIVLPQTNGLWAAVWGEADEPDYISAATIAVFEPPRRLVFSDFSSISPKPVLFPFKQSSRLNSALSRVARARCCVSCRPAFRMSRSLMNFMRLASKVGTLPSLSIKRYLTGSES